MSKIIQADEFKLIGTVYDDSKFPLMGQGLDTTSGRMGFNYFNGAAFFANNARYPDEPISMTDQMSHAWKEGTTIYPHIHWKQQSANIPNFLLAYKVIGNGGADVVETGYTNHTFLTLQSHAFTYTSGILNQISGFGGISMAGETVSSVVHYALFRDTGNASTEFAGADPSSLTELVTTFDVHYEIDTLGSREEYAK